MFLIPTSISNMWASAAENRQSTEPRQMLNQNNQIGNSSSNFCFFRTKPFKSKSSIWSVLSSRKIQKLEQFAKAMSILLQRSKCKQPSSTKRTNAFSKCSSCVKPQSRQLMRSKVSYAKRHQRAKQWKRHCKKEHKKL